MATIGRRRALLRRGQSDERADQRIASSSMFGDVVAMIGTVDLRPRWKVKPPINE